MTDILPSKSKIQYIETKLARQTDDAQRLYLLDLLASHFTFINNKKAQIFLSQQQEILERVDMPDFKLNYHWNTALIENQLYNFKLAEFSFKDALQIIEERGDANQQAEIYIDFAGTCMNLDQEGLAEQYLEKAEKLLDAFPDKNLEVRLICREGFLNLQTANYSKAIELFLEAEKRASLLQENLKLKDYYFFSLIHSGLGTVYEKNDEPQKGVRSYLKAVEMCESMNLRTRLSWHYLNVGNSFLAINQEENAELYFKKAIRSTDDNSQHTRASAYANLGYCYFRNQKYEQALELYSRAEQLYKEKKEDDYFNFANIELWRAYVQEDLGRKRKALKHYFTALDHAKKATDYRQLSAILKEIAGYYANDKNYKEAYDYQVLHDQAAEQYMQQINSRKINELEVKYEAEKKEAEAELLRLQATKLQLKALRAQMNPHFMYNALNSIQNFMTSNEVGTAAKYLAKFAQLMRQSLEYSDMEIISLEKEILFLKDYLTINAKLRFEDRLTYKIEVDDEIEEDILGVPTMIVQPYVENAIEHGLRNRKNGLVTVSFELSENEEQVICVVEDNGIGREATRLMKEQDPQFQNHRSLGTRITEDRLELLNKSRGEKGVFVKTIDLTDKNTGKALGTRVEIQIPIVEIQVKKVL
jgi:anti-sigma regulatory factor (Ser/Thr protein kinase)